MILSCTGHRPNKLGGEYSLVGPYTDYIKEKLFAIIDERRPDQIISGMALGVDQIWAICGIRRGIKVIAALPCEHQDSRWPSSSRDIYHKILDNELVTEHYCSTLPYSAPLTQKRNEWMVNNSDALIAVWDGSNGGTANCVRYAESINKQIIRVDISTLR